jgi:DNA-binding transcriptional LysR family regulator
MVVRIISGLECAPPPAREYDIRAPALLRDQRGPNAGLWGDSDSGRRIVITTPANASLAANMHALASSGSSQSVIIGRLRYKHLSLLVAVEEHRNLHQAAQVVHLSQPSASKIIRDLESAFGASLFDRLPTGMQPTELGSLVLIFARLALSELKRLMAEIEIRQAPRDRFLVLAATADWLPDTFATAVAEMGRRHPGLALKLRGDPYEDIANRLLDGHTDLAIGYFNGCSPHSAIEYRSIGSVPLCVVARKDHPLAHATALAPRELEGVAWVTHARADAALLALDPFCRRAGVTPPSNALESHALSTTLTLLMQTDAISILPECTVCKHLAAGRLARLPVEIAGNTIEFGVLSRRQESQEAPVAEFRGLLGQLFDRSCRAVCTDP